MDKLQELSDQGYGAIDVVVAIFRVVKASDRTPEYTRLKLIKEIGWTHMRVLQGIGTLVQLGGLVARLCKVGMKPDLFQI